MRKTLRTALGATLGTVLVSATMAVSATPAFANDCGTATPFSAQTQVGTIDAARPELWLAHDSNLDSRAVALATPAGSATLEVRDSSCTTVLCTDRASAAETATCTVNQSGPILIGVIRDVVAGGPDVDQAMAYVVNVLKSAPVECNDGRDNDGDGQADWPADPHCTSALDVTEAPIHLAAYGHITIETDGANVPRMTLTGVYANPQIYTCGLQTSPLIEVTCVQTFDPEVMYDCTHFILTAKAYSTSAPVGPGAAKGRIACDSSTSLSTDDVDSQSLVKVSVADNEAQGIDLGTAGIVRCRAMGVNGAPNATGAFSVDCWEPGVAWPVGTDPRG